MESGWHQVEHLLLSGRHRRDKGDAIRTEADLEASTFQLLLQHAKCVADQHGAQQRRIGGLPRSAQFAEARVEDVLALQVGTSAVVVGW